MSSSNPKSLRILIALVCTLLVGVIGNNLVHRALNAQLAEAVQAGHLSRVRKLLDWHADIHYCTTLPNDQYARPQSLLALSLQRLRQSGPVGMPERGQERSEQEIAELRAENAEAEGIACLLIERGANLIGEPEEIAQRHDSTPSFLAQACGSGSLTVVRAMLARGRTLAELDPGGKAVNETLNAFASVASVEPARSLSQQASKYNAFCTRSRREMLLFLRDHGARLGVELSMLLGEQNLRKEMPVASTELNNALYAAVYRHDGAMVRVMLSKGASPDRLLEEAAGWGDMSLVRLSLQKGAHVNSPTSQMSALARSVYGKHLEIARLLLAQGADIRWQDSQGRPILSDALQRMPELVPELLKRNAPVNPSVPVKASKTVDLTYLPIAPLPTALWYAPRFEQTLVHAGAKLGSDRELILVTAAVRGRTDLFARLIGYGADVNGTVHSDRSNKIPTSNELEGETPLTEAVQHARAGVRILLEHGANPNVETEHGRTPLILAALAGDVETTKLLLQHGADPNLQPHSSHTPLYYARKHQQTEVATLLEQAGGRSDAP